MGAFDGQMRASVSASLSGDLPDHSWWQATTGVTCGGLGLRTRLGSRFPPSWGAGPSWPSTTHEALARLVSTLPTNAAQLLVGQLDEALA